MDLTQITDPKFLKKLSIHEMEQLAGEIRHFLIESVSRTGGHLSSNLGVVELTIALHRVFNSPVDKIFFDVGHQCYIHKILTGRAKDFSKLRQYQGISGFQKRSESVHDVWEAGHSSTSLSAALGMAVARDLNHEHYHIVPVIGDGSMSSGMSLEALNQIGDQKRNLIIVFNDNNMSISQNVGALTNGFSKLRTSKGYNTLKADLKNRLDHNAVGKTVLKSMTAVKNYIKNEVVDSSVFGEFGLEYLGPVDGHDIKSLIQILEVAKKHEGPVVVHVLTKKGKGYPFCENDSEGKWHGVSSFNVETGMSHHSLPQGHLSWSQIVSEPLVRLAKQDERICAITPAMITGSKLEKFFALYPERSFDCGIAEEHAATFAAALALEGKRPFLCLYSSFLQRAYDQINHDICRMDLPVVIGIDRAGLVGEDGDTHHGVFDISILRSLPNLILAQPKDSNELQQILTCAFKQNHPFAIRYPRGSGAYQETVQSEPIAIGSWSIVYEPEQVNMTVITYGPDVDRLKNKMMTNNLPIRIVNARFFKPLDEKMLMMLSDEQLPVLIYETDMKAGGLSSAVLEWCCDHHKTLKIERIGIGDHYVTFGAMNQIRRHEHIDLNTVCEACLKLLNKERGE
ncbi:MAG: 1-deoxy-D-xylulose-5-phosphate synthase [Erysipelotrichaceae bacterium]|nr:1-deoxy-D-xylulose-5-phosphate synthase [Erysipelotrichaceae bacterium]